MEFSCKCHNSGVNSFTGRCSNCGMTKPSQGVFTSEKRIKQLISSTPNDFELGRLIREMYSER